MAKKNKELNFDEVIFDEAAKDKDLEHLELPLSRRIFWGVGIAAILLMLISLGRIFYINVTRGEFYMQRAGINANKEIVIPAPRGIITDRFGEPLVGNASVLSVFVDVGALFKEYNRDKIVGVAKELAEILSLDQSDIEQMLSEVNLERNNFVLVRRDVSVAEGIAIRSLNSPFVKLINDYARLYIDGPIFSHIVGYTGFADSGNEIVGKAGLEDYYDWRLSGREGSSILYRDTYGNILEDRIVNEPVAGEQLVTAIDADLQRYFYNSLKLGLRRLGRDAGVGIAINPQSGEILALVSMPSYDNNLLISRGNDDVKKAILNSSRQPLFNRAIAGTYSPGSTIKPLVALAALKDGVIDPAHQIFSAGFIEIPNLYFPNQPSRFLDWKAHGWVDLRSALARSSNIYFYAVGGGLDDIKGLGIEKLKYYWQYFGFGKIMGVDMANESSGYLPDPQKKENNSSDIWRIGDTYNISIGQGDLSVSPLQLISFIASIANGGKIYRPHFSIDIKSEILIDYSDWTDELKEVQLGMLDAVSKSYGTAHLLNDLSFAVAAKTGSAQVANNTRTNAFFVGYLPTETLTQAGAQLDKQIAILVLIEDSREGSLNAVPIGKDVLEWYYNNRVLNSVSSDDRAFN